MSIKTCVCGNGVDMGHYSGRHKGSDFGIVHGRCGECGRLWDDIKSEWVIGGPRNTNENPTCNDCAMPLEVKSEDGNVVVGCACRREIFEDWNLRVGNGRAEP